MLHALLAGRENSKSPLTASLPEGVALHVVIRPSQDTPSQVPRIVKRKTPQEKKLSEYVRDGRNLVAESRSIAHKAIAKRKAWVNKSFRKVANQTLSSSLSLSEESLEQAELASSQVQRHDWRKQPDVPLAKYVEFKQGFVSGKRDQIGKKTELRSLAAKLAKARYGR